ncbi:MAG TPA: hypothetical protein VGG31_00550 [Candidatus Dormibacteraeota bacterium]
MPPASAILRLIAFAVPSGLAMSGVQPLVSAATGAVETRWAVGLAAPALVGALLIYAAGRAFDRGDAVQPPWYAAYALFPGAFLVAGAAAMCIFGALVQFEPITLTLWFLLLSGSALWTGAMVLVRVTSH